MGSGNSRKQTDRAGTWKEFDVQTIERKLLAPTGAFAYMIVSQFFKKDTEDMPKISPSGSVSDRFLEGFGGRRETQ